MYCTNCYTATEGCECPDDAHHEEEGYCENCGSIGESDAFDINGYCDEYVCQEASEDHGVDTTKEEEVD